MVRFVGFVFFFYFTHAAKCSFKFMVQRYECFCRIGDPVLIRFPIIPSPVRQEQRTPNSDSAGAICHSGRG